MHFSPNILIKLYPGIKYKVKNELGFVRILFDDQNNSGCYIQAAKSENCGDGPTTSDTNRIVVAQLIVPRSYFAATIVLLVGAEAAVEGAVLLAAAAIRRWASASAVAT